MRARRTPSPVPARLKQGHRRFETWRKNRKRRRIPETLWRLAIDLAEEYGVHRTARTLRLNDDSLRKRLAAGGVTRSLAKASRSPFVELVTTPIAAAAETTIELEDGSGKMLRISLKGGATPDVIALASTLWSGNR